MRTPTWSLTQTAIASDPICDFGYYLDGVIQSGRATRNLLTGGCFGTLISAGGYGCGCGQYRYSDTFHVSVNQLSNGGHQIIGFAASDTGVYTYPSFSFGVDNVMPVVSIATPGPGWRRGTAVVTAAGSTTGPSGIPAVSCDGTSHPGPVATLTFTGTGEFKGTCQSINGALVASSPAAYDVLLDNSPPTGVWHPVQYMTDPRWIVVQVADAQSGVAGGQIALTYPDGSVHVIPTTFNASAGTLAGFVDDDRLPAGTYRATALVADAVGNMAAVGTQADGSPLYVPIPLRTPTAVLIGSQTSLRRSCDLVRVRLAPVRHKGRIVRNQRPRSVLRRTCAMIAVPAGGHTLRLAHNQGGTISGVVETVSGQPLAGASIVVSQQPAGWPAQTLGTITADAQGRFEYVVPSGPSRTISLSFPGTERLHDATAVATVASRGAGTLHAQRRMQAGRRLHLSGRVLGLIPPSGVLVQLQYWLVGRSSDWAPFGKPVRTRADGRWSTTVDVSSAAAGSLYRINALVPAQNGWPYLSTVTAPVTRRVG